MVYKREKANSQPMANGPKLTATNNRNLPTGNRQQVTESRQPTTRNHTPATENWQLTTGPWQLATLLLLIILSTSCNSYKKISYFQNVQDSIYNNPETIALAHFTDPKIQPNDILQVSVQTLDPQGSSMAGTSNTSTFSVQASSSLAAGGSTVPGFLVDKNGMIELPMVGKIEVAGKTTAEAREAIRTKAAIYYKEPVVNVRFANFNITVLGEVARPAQYTVPNEKATLLDAIGMAGDLTIYGKRENVMLIREEDGKKKVIRFDLNNSSTFQNPYFYLRQGDVIYVQPNKAKAAANDISQTRNITIITSALTLLVVIVSRINF